MKLPALPFAAIATAVVATTIFASSTILDTTTALPHLPTMPFKQYNTAGDIPKQMFQKNSVVYGKVVKVIDGDTFRVRHYPFYPLRLRSEYTGKLSEHTMSVRIYGVDAPELAHFGNPTMPKAQDAKEWASSVVDGKIVRIKLLRRDQYNRAVAKVTTKGFLPFTKKDLSIGLVEQGYGTLYTGGGAEYDGKRQVLERKIKVAQKKKKGIWENGQDILTPAEYKRQAKEKKAAGTSAAPATKSKVKATTYSAQAY